MIVRTFLTGPAEREAFAEWLRDVVARSGRSKLQVSRALGSGTTGKLNRYLRGEVFPTAKSAATIATFCGVLRIDAFLRGGFYRELFAEVTVLATTSRSRHFVAQALVACFPRRGDRYRSTLHPAALQLSNHTFGIGHDFVNGLKPSHDDPAELSAELALASDIAYDTSLPQDTRRAIIAELCDAWVRNITSSKKVDGFRRAFFTKRAIIDTSETLSSFRQPTPTLKVSSK